MQRTMAWFGPILLLLAAVFLAAGLFMPIMRLDQLYFFSQSPSLVELVAALYRNGDVLLALVVAVFSIAFPIAKLAGLGLQLAFPHRKAGIFGRIMPHLSKWSMMDVMLVAIVVFAAKSSGLASAVSQPGLWFYTASAILAGLLPLFMRARAGGVSGEVSGDRAK